MRESERYRRETVNPMNQNKEKERKRKVIDNQTIRLRTFWINGSVLAYISIKPVCHVVPLVGPGPCPHPHAIPILVAREYAGELELED